MPSHILVVEDERDLQRVITYNLKQAGFDVVSAPDGETALRARARGALRPGAPRPDAPRHAGDRGLPAAQAEPGDRGHPGGDGHGQGRGDRPHRRLRARRRRLRGQALQRARAHPARARHPAARRGRRTRPRSASPSACSSRSRRPPRLGRGRGGRPHRAGARLLTMLYDRRGRVLTRDLLLDEVWGSHVDVTARNVDTHVKRVREKLGAAGEYIETVRGVGYRFRGEQPTARHRRPGRRQRRRPSGRRPHGLLAAVGSAGASARSWSRVALGERRAPLRARDARARGRRSARGRSRSAPRAERVRRRARSPSSARRRSTSSPTRALARDASMSCAPSAICSSRILDGMGEGVLVARRATSASSSPTRRCATMARLGEDAARQAPARGHPQRRAQGGARRRARAAASPWCARSSWAGPLPRKLLVRVSPPARRAARGHARAQPRAAAPSPSSTTSPICAGWRPSAPTSWPTSRTSCARPVTAISTAAETLLGGALDDPEDAAEFVGVIDRHASACASSSTTCSISPSSRRRASAWRSPTSRCARSSTHAIG